MVNVPERYRCYKPKEVAEALRIVSESTLRHKAKLGEIPYHLGPKNSVWFTVDDIDAILSDLHRPAVDRHPLERVAIEVEEVNPFRTTSRSRTAHRVAVLSEDPNS